MKFDFILHLILFYKLLSIYDYILRLIYNEHS